VRAQWRASASRAETMCALSKLLAVVQKKTFATQPPGARGPFLESSFLPGSFALPSLVSGDGVDGAAHVAPPQEPDGDGQAQLRLPGIEASGPTTLMVHNLPAGCTEQQLLEAWPIDGSYDFLYAPKSNGDSRLAGFAFVNFTSQAAAAAFASRWHGERWLGLRGDRAMRVSTAHCQGLEANIEQLGTTRGRMHKALRRGLVVIHGSRWPRVEEP